MASLDGFCAGVSTVDTCVEKKNGATIECVKAVLPRVFGLKVGYPQKH